MQFKDYYKVLGVEPGADAATSKSAYRRLAKKYHPDKSSEAGAEDRFKEINEANEVLGDPARKAEYDQLRAGGFRSGEEFRPPPGWQGGQFDFGDGPRGDFSDFFESLFGRGRGGGGRNCSASAWVRPVMALAPKRLCGARCNSRRASPMCWPTTPPCCASWGGMLKRWSVGNRSPARCLRNPPHGWNWDCAR